jgi:hypothetical protein
MAETETSSLTLNIEGAAERVGRSGPTIRRWIREGMLFSRGGYMRESDLLRVDKLMRDRRHEARLTRDLLVVEAGEVIGKLTVNTVSGKIVRGEINLSNIVDSVHTDRVR